MCRNRIAMQAAALARKHGVVVHVSGTDQDQPCAVQTRQLAAPPLRQ